MNFPEIRWGILGTGQIASQFVEGLLQTPGARVTGVGSRSAEKARAFAGRYGIAKAFGSYEELAGARDVDICYIATPNSLHAEHSLLALNADKAVLCEKPFALNAEQGRLVIETAQKHGLFCMEAMWMRCLPAFIGLRALVEGGEIGEPQMISANLGMRIAGGPDHRVYNPALGGGALLDLGIYTISFAQAFFGKPISVQGSADIGKTGVDEQSAGILLHERGRISTLSCSIKHEMPSDALVMGDRGWIRVHAPLYRFSVLTVVKGREVGPGTNSPAGSMGGLDRIKRWASKIEPYLPMREIVRYARGAQRRGVFPYIGNGYTHEAREAMRCIRAGERESPLISWQDTLDGLETMDRLRVGWSR